MALNYYFFKIFFEDTWTECNSIEEGIFISDISYKTQNNQKLLTESQGRLIRW